ncbi:MAG: patatin-like phospholipase family protein [Bacteroidota bacterium]
MAEGYKLGLVLSGGGARGIAHIGVLKALEEHHIFPDIIAGASAGAIVGAFYAAGASPQEMLNIARASSFIAAFRPRRIPFGGLTDLQYLRNLMQKHIGHDSFDQLKKPLRIAATNLNKGSLELLSSGSLQDAVVASSSIPMVFQPVTIEEQQFVDGGLLNNLPAQALRPHCDFLLGVNVMPIVEVKTKKGVNSMIEIATRSFELSVWNNTQLGAASCDLVIEPKALRKYHIFQLSAAELIFEVGYEATMEQMPALLKALL